MAELALPVAGASSRRLARAAAVLAPVILCACSQTDIAVRAGLAAGKAVVGERSVADAARDAVVEAAIEEALFQTHVDDLYLPVNVDVFEGRALLTGVMDSRESAAEAAAIARGVDGVREAIDELRVGDRSPVDEAQDRWIAARLRARLVADLSVRDYNFVIVASAAVVHVLGVARDSGELDRVARHARAIEYVRGAALHAVLADDPARGGGS